MESRPEQRWCAQAWSLGVLNGARVELPRSSAGPAGATLSGGGIGGGRRGPLRGKYRLGGRHARPRLALVPEVAQRQLERGERRQHVERTRGDAHGPDPERAGPELI